MTRPSGLTRGHRPIRATATLIRALRVQPSSEWTRSRKMTYLTSNKADTASSPATPLWTTLMTTRWICWVLISAKTRITSSQGMGRIRGSTRIALQMASLFRASSPREAPSTTLSATESSHLTSTWPRATLKGPPKVVTLADLNLPMDKTW